MLTANASQKFREKYGVNANAPGLFLPSDPRRSNPPHYSHSGGRSCCPATGARLKRDPFKRVTFSMAQAYFRALCKKRPRSCPAREEQPLAQRDHNKEDWAARLDRPWRHWTSWEGSTASHSPAFVHHDVHTVTCKLHPFAVFNILEHNINKTLKQYKRRLFF